MYRSRIGAALTLCVAVLPGACGTRAPADDRPATASSAQRGEVQGMTSPTDQQTRPPLKLDGGSWEGRYFDAYGHRGELRFELEVGDDRVRGEYTLTVRAEDRPQVFRGQLDGKVEGERVRLAATTGREQSRIEFDAVVRPAGSYARQALFGVVTGAPQQGFGGGVWIVWHFAAPDRGR